MNDLKSWYRSNLVSRIDALENAKKNLNTNPEETIDSIRRIAHSLRGSGATYGFPEISEAAAKVEEADNEAIPDTLEHFLHTLTAIAGEKSDKNNVLIIEDDVDICHLLQLTLSSQNNYHVHLAYTAQEANQYLADNSVDLILLDMVLPDMDGRNLILLFRENPTTAMVPIIVLSARGGKQIQSECLALGADAYYIKPFDPKTVASAAKAQLDRAKQFSRFSQRDPLTQLPNRAAFREMMEKQTAKMQATSHPSALALLDLDYMESLNDQFGQAKGDKIIKTTAALIQENLPDYTYAARWKGASFAVYFPRKTEHQAAEIITGLKDSLRTVPFEFLPDPSLKISFSAGVIEMLNPIPFDELTAKAEETLYLAKSAGRNCVLTSSASFSPLKKQLLLADDDPLTASIIQHRLTREGFEVIHAQDGQEALDIAKNQSFSLAILDVKMPVIDGFQLLKELRQMTAFRKTPIIMLTSLGEEKDIVRGFSLGANDYMQKPFSPIELLARIHRVLKS